jgi:hypothetical protein
LPVGEDGGPAAHDKPRRARKGIEFPRIEAILATKKLKNDNIIDYFYVFFVPLSVDPCLLIK